MSAPDRLLTAGQAAALIPGALSARTLNRYAVSGRLRTAARLPGGARRFHAADVLALLDPAAATR